MRGALGTVGLPELTALRKTLLAWLRSADAAGLDEAGMVALFISALRDFHDRAEHVRRTVPAMASSLAVWAGSTVRRG